ncbi:MAG: twin-arginine translocase TatA/TatE family subunit [Sphingobacteriales bacterium]|nr:twin-arginine translocase TatA/TatE family subunit [Sphingobacteriales bacterium]
MLHDYAGWIGTPEIIIIFAALLLLFGGKKIPELMRGIGRGIREFNQAKEKVKSEIEEGMKGEPVKEEKTKNSEKDD